MACKCHVHAAWSCANCQINYKYLLPVTVVAVVTVPCSANGFIWCFQLNQLKSFSPTIVGLSSCYTPNCLTKSHLCLLPTSTLPAFFFFLNIQTIPVPLLTLSHYCCSPTQSVPSTPYSTHSFPSMSDFSPEIDIAVQTWHGSKNFSRTQFLHTYCLHLSLLTSCLFLFFFFLNTPPKLLFIILCIAHELGTNFAKRN